MRAIMIPVADRPECRAALKTTFELAKRLGADVVGCHFRPSAAMELENLDMADLWSMNQRRAWPASGNEAAAEAAAAAKRLFESHAAGAGYALSSEAGSREKPNGAWKEVEGAPPDLMASVGGASDLIVASRAPARGGEKAWTVLISALLDSLRPVLVLPQQDAQVSGRRVAIAWNRGRTETLALHAALPLVQSAEDVVLLTVGSGARGRGPSSDEMRVWLARHGVNARVKQIDRNDEGRALVDAAKEENADVLLAGAYTRGRFREMVFGGVTEYLITKTEFPVVLMHA